MKWLCFSGWAVKHGELMSLLPADCSAEEINYNFYNSADFPDIKKIIPQEPYSILSYSMGTLHALEAAMINPPEKIISIAGFSFFPGFTKDTKLRKMLILKMIKGLQVNPEKTVDDFINKAGLPKFSFEDYNCINLKKGLELLKDCDMSQALENELNLTLITSENDEIVPGHISSQLLQGPGERQNISIPGSHGACFQRCDELRRILE